MFVLFFFLAFVILHSNVALVLVFSGNETLSNGKGEIGVGCQLPNIQGATFLEFRPSFRIHIAGGSVSNGAIIQMLCPGANRMEYIGDNACQRDGTWSPKNFGICVSDLSTSCLDPLPFVPNGFVGSGSNSKGAVRVISCNFGYQKIGPGSIFCDGSGRWSPLITECRPSKF